MDTFYIKLNILVLVWATTSSLYTNPIINSNNPDPGILALPDGSGYVVVSTSNYATFPTGIDVYVGINTSYSVRLFRPKTSVPRTLFSN